MTAPPAVRTSAPPQPPRASIAPGLAALVAVAALATIAAAAVPALSPLVVAIVLGALFANTVAVPASWTPGIAFGARTLLRAGVVLLGLRLSLGDVVDLGTAGVVVVAATVLVTFFGTRLLARVLGVPSDLGLLVATGYSICGASAIVAVDGVVRADEEETAYAVTLVTLCGTLSIFVLPLVADAIGLTGAAFGTWVGGAVHDVGQVVAAASTGDAAALRAATVVKLTRVVLLAPLVAVIAVRRRSEAHDDGRPGHTTRPPIVPLFVGGFLAMIVVRSTGVVDAAVIDGAARLEKGLLTVALVGLGFGVRVDRMRRLGGRPLALGLASWVLVAGVALAGTLAVG